MRQAVDELRKAGNLFYGFWGTGLLVETLLGVAPRAIWPKPRPRSSG